MANTTSITLGAHFDEFTAQLVKTGNYGSVSEVVRVGLRLLENTEKKVGTLRQLLEEGEESGYVEYSYENLMQELDLNAPYSSK